MEASKFNDLMAKHGVAYITYAPQNPVNGRKTTFVVGTTEFDDKHIARVEAQNTKTFGSPRPDVAEGEVLIFSYSKDKFRTIKLDTVKRVTGLNVELRKATSVS